MQQLLKSGIGLEIDNCIAIVNGAPTIINKSGLMAGLCEAIGRTTYGHEIMGSKRDALTFSLPIELHMLCSFTIAMDGNSSSILETVAMACNIAASQIVPEYPNSDRAKEALDFADNLLRSANRRAALCEDRMVKSRLENAATCGWMEQVSLDMRSAIEEFGLKDTPMDDGDQQPTIDTRLAVLLDELRRLRVQVANA